MSAPTPLFRKADPSKVVKETFRIPNEDIAVVLRRLRAIDKVEIGIYQSGLLRGIPASNLNNEAQEYSYLLATLMVALVEPKDVSFADMDGEDVLQLWKEWDEWSRSFRELGRIGVEPASGPVSE